MLSSIPGIENLSPAVKYVIAFAIIFLLLALFALILRRLTGGKLGVPNDRGRTRQPRLGIVDVYDLDRQRQLILLRRDNVEHLLLVGGPNDVVVETNIVRVPGARLPTAGAAETVDRIEPPVERVPEIASARPVIEPSAARIDKGPAEREPVHKPLAEGAPSVFENPPDELSLPPAPNGVASTSTRLSKTPVRSVEAGAVRSSAPASPAARTPRSNLQANPSSSPFPTLGATPTPSEPVELSRPASSGANLSDMARQLEDALKRPEPAPAPEPPRVAPPAPRPAPLRRPDSPPVLTALEGAPGSMPSVSPATPPPPVSPTMPAITLPAIVLPPALPAITVPLTPASSAPSTNPPMPAAMVAIPLPRPAEPKPAPEPLDFSPATPPPPVANLPALAPSGQTSARDPFSIEDIEAEFARLLGRPLDRKEDKN